MLPRKRRLTQRTGASQASTRRARADPATDDPDAAADLPPYLPQACSLTPEAVSALRSLYQNLGTTKIDEHIRDSLTYLGAGTAALNATLQSSRYQVDNMGEKKEAEKARLEKEVGKMEDITKGMTGEAEEAVRAIVDLRGELEDEKGVFESGVEVSTARRREQEQRRAERQRQKQARAAENEDDEGANGAEEDEDMSDEEEPQAISDMMRDLADRKAQNYAQMTMHQRYALNNDYADFKRQWHNGLHGEDAVLPDAKRWFSENNRPIFNFGRSTDEDEDGNIDGDTDLIVERATVSTRCPLSLRELEEPYSNKLCKHTFERTAIMEYIGRQGRRVTCPQSGCHVTFTKNDFYLDRAMLDRIRRMRSRREAEGEEGEDDEDMGEEDEDEDIEEEAEAEEAEAEEAEEEAEEEPEPELPRSARSRRSVKRERMDEEA